MSYKSVAVLLLIAAACSACGSGPRHPSLANRDLVELLPVRAFVADRDSNQDFKISPDGRRLAWRSVCGIRACIKVRHVTADAETSFGMIPGAFDWSQDSTSLIYTDHSGHTWIADVTGNDMVPRNLTPGARAVQTLSIPRDDPAHILVAHNRRDAESFDLYRIRLSDGRETLLGKNNGKIYAWISDEKGQLRARVSQDGETRRLETLTGENSWKPVLEWTIFDHFTVLGADQAGTGVWVLSNVGRDKIALSRIALDSGREELLSVESDTDYEFEANRPVIGPKRRSPLLAIAEPGFPRHRFFDPRVKRALESFLESGPARVRINSISESESVATVDVYDGVGTSFYLVDLASTQKTLLGRDVFSKHRALMAKSEPIQFVSRDGLTIHGFLTRPRGLEKLGNLPLVLRVRGGPWWNSVWGNTNSWGAAATVQFLANRGYAVLELNYRGSTGYGKKFTELAKGEFAGTMQNDLLDGVQWAIDQGIADPQKMAIVGGSYGGYATLIGMSATPDRFSCGIAHAAPTDLSRLIENFPPHGELEQPYWYRYVGNPKDPANRAIMDKKSPIFHVGAIKKPLLITHGTSDHLVEVMHAKMLAEKLASNRREFELVVLEGEGHVNSSWQSHMKVFRKTEDFLAQCLGGRTSGFDFYQLGTWLP